MEITSVWVLTVHNTYKGDTDVDVTVYSNYDAAWVDFKDAAQEVLDSGFRFDDVVINGEGTWVEAYCKNDRSKFYFSAELSKKDFNENDDVLFRI